MIFVVTFVDISLATSLALELILSSVHLHVLFQSRTTGVSLLAFHAGARVSEFSRFSVVAAFRLSAPWFVEKLPVHLFIEKNFCRIFVIVSRNNELVAISLVSLCLC